MPKLPDNMPFRKGTRTDKVPYLEMVRCGFQKCLCDHGYDGPKGGPNQTDISVIELNLTQTTFSSGKADNLSASALEPWWGDGTPSHLRDVPVSIISNRQLSIKSTVLGEGVFATVVLGSLGSGTKVAVKSFTKGNFTTDAIMNEARILSYLQDTGWVVKTFGVSYSKDFTMSLVQDYFADGVTLFDVLYEWPPLSNKLWALVINQLTYGLKAIHKKGILLNDLKDDNVLVDSRSNYVKVKFIDFGLATFKTGHVYHIDIGERSKRPHLAPEVMNGQPTQPSSDVYSLGLILENISFQADICGLCDVVAACMDIADRRPTVDDVIRITTNLRPL